MYEWVVQTIAMARPLTRHHTTQPGGIVPLEKKDSPMNDPTEGADFLIADNLINVIFGLGGDDAIFGLGGGDILSGDAGNDLLVGGRGDDALNGGKGFDTANFNDASFDVTADLVSGHALIDLGGSTEDDLLISIEGLTGGGGNDHLYGNSAANSLAGMNGYDSLDGREGNDRLYGGDGNDNLTGGTGADVLNGGAGIDTVLYDQSTAGVNVNLSTGVGSGGEAAGDMFSGIEDVLGSKFNETLTGNALSNIFFGGLGDDSIAGGGGDDIIFGGTGADTMNGGSGVDRIDYDGGSAGIKVDLVKQTATGGDATGDVFSSIEDVAGTDFADTLTGNSASNTLWGRAGNDKLSGAAGADDLTGGLGHDVMPGGTGADRFIYFGLAESGATTATRDVITDFTTGEDLLFLAYLDANAIVAGHQGFNFIDTAAFSGPGPAAAGELRVHYAGANTFLEGDTDGNGAADFQILFTGHLTFGLGDFVI